MRDDDLIGEEVMDDAEVLGQIEDILGAAQPSRAMTRPASAARRSGVQFRGTNVRRAPPILTDLPAGVQSGPTGKILTVPFTPVVFVNAGAIVGQLVARPQVPCRGRRLIIIAAGSAAAAQIIAAGALVTGITIGAQPGQVNAGNTPVQFYAPDATTSEVLWPVASPGIEIVINVAIPVAPAVGETVTISAGLYAEAVS